MQGVNEDWRTSPHKLRYWEIGDNPYGAYTKVDLKQVDYNAIQLNAKEITQLLRILEDLEDLFDGTQGD